MQPSYNTHFGFTDKPFKPSTRLDQIYRGPTLTQALDNIAAALAQGAAAVVVTGESGCGKSTLLQLCSTTLATSLHCVEISETQPLLAGILKQLKIELIAALTVPSSETVTWQTLLAAAALRQQRLVLLLDNAHRLPPAALQELLALPDHAPSNTRPLQLVLFGQPALADTLSQQQPSAANIVQHRLEPWRAVEVDRYVQHQLQCAGHTGDNLFTPAAIAEIATRAQGTPRTINTLCDWALTLAQRQQSRTISAECVAQAASFCLLERKPLRETLLAPTDRYRLRVELGLLTIAALLGLIAWGNLSLPSFTFDAPPVAAIPPTVLPATPAAPVTPPATTVALPDPPPAAPATPPALTAPPAPPPTITVIRPAPLPITVATPAPPATATRPPPAPPPESEPVMHRETVFVELRGERRLVIDAEGHNQGVVDKP